MANEATSGLMKVTPCRAKTAVEGERKGTDEALNEQKAPLRAAPGKQGGAN